jgi:hypothetical protein
MCWWPQTSGYSYLRVTAIQIDVHLVGETWPTHHTHPTLILHMVPDHTYLTRSTHGNLSCSRQQIWKKSTAPKKKGSRPNSQHVDWPVRRSVPNFSHITANEAVGKRQASIDNRLLGIPGPYLRHVIDTFNTCSRGPTHRSLTDTSRVYNLGGASFPCHTPWPSQSTVLRFPPKGPARSQVIQSQHKPLVQWCETPIADPWSLDHSASTEAYVYA